MSISKTLKNADPELLNILLQASNLSIKKQGILCSMILTSIISLVASQRGKEGEDIREVVASGIEAFISDVRKNVDMILEKIEQAVDDECVVCNQKIKINKDEINEVNLCFNCLTKKN